jgi:hypothetical protein
MSEYLRIPVKFSGSRTVSIGAGASTTSDLILLSGNAVMVRGTFKADNAGAPASGHTVNVRLLSSAGDPDGEAAVEFSSADNTHSFLICQLDTNVTDPAIRSAHFPAFREIKINAVNNAGNAVTFSCVLEELIS